MSSPPWWGGESGAPEIARLLGAAKLQGAIVISGVVAELMASPNITEPELIAYLERRAIQVDFQLEAQGYLEAGRRFRTYALRRRQIDGSEPKRLLADFLVGAHALLRADRLMTLDVTRYQRDFPDLRLITA